ncbi:MAG: membrane-bound lytic murein transglycosylase B [Alpinimonas sp.]|jgi:membrane-bound lytic murein transglycosylase B
MASQKVRLRRTLIVAGLVVGMVWVISSCAVASVAPPQAVLPFPVAEPLPVLAVDVAVEDIRTTPVNILADAKWVTETAQATGIPERTLFAYAGVALRKSATDPTCQVSWNTLAAIGWVESHHGTIFGGTILPNGFASEPIYGVPLTGGEFMNIPDFDDGNFDGTAEYDRAVGPMQIIPATWAAWHVDGNLDGSEDGQQIDDSTMVAAGYLCFSGTDLSTYTGWDKAVTAYNQAPQYIIDIAAKADEYAGSAPTF